MREQIERAKEAGQGLAEKIRLVIRRMMILIVLLITSVPLMWAVNITGYREWNFIPFFLGAVAILSTAFRFDTILFAFGAGTLHHVLTDWNLSQGVQSGVRTWRKITAGTLSIFWATAGLLTVHPWHESPISFWILTAAILVVVSFLEYHELKLRALKLTLIFGYAGAVSIYALLNTIPSLWQGKVFDTITGAPLVMMESDGSWIDYDRGPKDCMEGCYSPYTGKKLIPVTPEAAERQGWNKRELSDDPKTTQPVMIQARASGQIIAPASRWSDWLKFSQTGLCFRVWTANPGTNDIQIRYIDLNGEKWSYGGGHIADATAISFKSKLGMPVGISYETWPKAPGKECKKV